MLTITPQMWLVRYENQVYLSVTIRAGLTVNENHQGDLRLFRYEKPVYLRVTIREGLTSMCLRLKCNITDIL
jgi:hypothetical protein